ncbi:beta-glucosidase [Motilibacter peucedani]|uniref:Beta-glucosidase n=1 Tax=Motilibacter peucedani TaxID=598650 RepID=A0A420XTC1_9ACTN|nr:glycoside hydrolase family 3 N-terminal domain-containing protein [Motilibacter peucedani]RKS80007.1 beta-glucosidase [Motilibacter peucedani]
MTTSQAAPASVWQDPSAAPASRAADLLEQMTLEEKVAQLYGVWVGLDDTGDGVAPHQHDFAGPELDWTSLIARGLGQLTRPFGTRPVEPRTGAQGLARSQEEITGANRFGIPALVHEECLTGLTAWQATIYPNPLCWGATFDPSLVEEMAARIGRSMQLLGVHQGLAPVLDVVRDLRWGRVEETIGEDPYLVGEIATAYVRGLQSAGVVATLKHFAGYSASRAARNLAPVSIGPRELADVILPPFEMALAAGARSVMNAYTDMDGVPAAADERLLTDLLRGTFGFEGTVVADYFAVAFLHTLHNVAGTPAEAAHLALLAGIDVELPTVNCFGDTLVEAVRSGAVPETLVDRACARVLTQKAELGLLDPDWSPEPEALALAGVDLDDAESRALARTIAESSVVLLANDGTLPLAPGRRIAVVGPRADDSSAMLGCYSFPMHVGAQHPDVAMGVDVPTVLESLRAVVEGQVTHARGCGVVDGTDEEIAEAVAAARGADVCVAVLGDRAGLFGRGTSGEGCDASDLRLPGRQEELLEALLATGTPVVLVLLVGRPYEIGRQVERLAASVVGFFPGEEGGPALAGVLTGAVNPSGKLPVHFPREGATQPSTYLAPPLGRKSEVSNIDPGALFAFGHGTSYASLDWGRVSVDTEVWATDGTVTVSVELSNASDREASEVVQVYLNDPAAEVVRPVQQLVGALRVRLAPGESTVAHLQVHADQTSYTGRAGRRIVDTGHVELQVGASSVDVRAALPLEMTGERREVGHGRVLAATSWVD